AALRHGAEVSAQLTGGAHLRVEAVDRVRRRPRHEDGSGFVGHDRGVEVKGRDVREELARLLDREGIRVDLVREWCREAGVTVHTDLPEPDGRAAGDVRLPGLGAGVLKASVTRFEAVRIWARARTRLLRIRRREYSGRDVVRPQAGGAGTGRTHELVHPDEVVGIRYRGGQRGVGPLVEDNGRRDRPDIPRGPLEEAKVEGQIRVQPVLREEDHGTPDVGGGCIELVAGQDERFLVIAELGKVPEHAGLDDIGYVELVFLEPMGRIRVLRNHDEMIL